MGVRGQPQGWHLRGFDGTGGTWSGWTHSIRHPSPMSKPGRVGIRGGDAGAEPPHKGGPNRPDRPNCSGQWLVVSCQRLRMVCLRVDRGRERASLLAEVQESSPQFWDTIRPISLANFGLIGYTKWWQKPCLSESRAHAFSPIGEADDRPKRALRRERKSTSKLREGTPRLMMAEAKTQDDIVAGERE